LRKEIISNIDANVSKWSFNKQLAFAYLACLRTYPNYWSFYREFKFGDPEILAEDLVLIKACLLNGNFDPEKTGKVISEIDVICPSPENYETILASSAMDCCGCIESTLKFITDHDTEKVIEVIDLCLDTIDMFLVDSLKLNQADANLESIIYNHPLMLREVGIQERIINCLNETPGFNSSDLDALVAIQQIDGRDVGSIDAESLNKN